MKMLKTIPALPVQNIDNAVAFYFRLDFDIRAGQANIENGCPGICKPLKICELKEMPVVFVFLSA